MVEKQLQNLGVYYQIYGLVMLQILISHKDEQPLNNFASLLFDVIL